MKRSESMNKMASLQRFFGWLMVGALLLLLGATALAQTSDTPSAAPSVSANVPAAAVPAPPPSGSTSSYNWTGFYVGAHVGHGWGNGDTKVDPLPSAATFVNLLPQTLHPDPSGIVAGGQVGYNHQWQLLVLGAEADISGTGMDGTRVVTPITQNNNTPFPGAGFIRAQQSTSWFGTLRGRVGGTPVPRLLIYGTGGLAFGHVEGSANTDFRPVGTEQYPATMSATKAGWVVGGGAEIGIARHWSAKFEFLRYNLGKERVLANPVPPLPPFGINYTWAAEANVFSGGVNYRF